ncbi:SPOSA6832_04398 [Sporobolomyces salmonicolor]|uniref:Coatomer subunit gamma n=1 Tax=Sporidiobolus salmonicolor TaxID=5005 RepID=A0A0D6ES10_SPOSA|nr:SPOSA6832_04398 [Sporobolomyces salmonicolor]
MSAYKKDEESGVGTFFQDKTTVIQEARVFNETPISPRKCRILLTKIVYLLYAGETFGTQEATTLFFGVTKLFQHKDSALRQMVYLVIKELSGIAEDVIMVTSSIMKDMQPNLEVIYRPNAIRALCRIIDGSMIVGVERFFKAAIVDRNTSISSAALVSAYHLHPIARDVIKRWANEAAEAVQNKGASMAYGSHAGYQAMQSSSSIVQYHALGLLYLIRQGDRMAVTKMIQQLSGAKGSGGILRSPFAICMLIRFAAKVMEEDLNVQRAMYELIEGYLKHKSDMVNYEAARAICEMKNVGANELYRPIAVLQLFLSSPKAALKFAAIRTLAKLAQTHPNAVQTCNLDMEKLINDDNRSVATFAITTLLKTGNEASVDRLMKQISQFMGEISDEFKVIVVNAIRALCLKFPAKQSVMLNFLSGVLRDEGGYDFKRAVVEAIFDMIKFIGDSKEAGMSPLLICSDVLSHVFMPTALAQLCEFIEDCEFTKLSVRILHLLGVEGPKTPQPSKYIRYIYNRVVLENAIVRAAAVSSLAKFGVNVADAGVKKSIQVLLTRCLDDVDDEVRDRAAFNLKLLNDEPLADAFVRDASTFSLDALESRLASYVADQEGASTPFDFASVPKVSKEQVLDTARRAFSTFASRAPVDTDLARNAGTRADAINAVAIASDATGIAADAGSPAPSASEQQSAYAKQLAEVPELAEYGPVLKSSLKPVELTERETEYVVSCVKHVFAEHVVFQFNVRNTVDAVHLEQVSVIMSPSEEGELEEDFIIPVPSLGPNSSGIVYVSFTRANPVAFATGSFTNTLKFVSKEVDPESGEPEEEGYDDEYQIEELDLGAGDYIVPSYAAFATEWDRLRSGATAQETFALTALDSLKTACDSLLDILGMEALGGTEAPTSASVHTLNMSGLVCGGAGKVLARARMTYQTGKGVVLELTVRAEQESAAQLVISAIA